MSNNLQVKHFDSREIAFCLIGAECPIVPYFSAFWNCPILVPSMFIGFFSVACDSDSGTGMVLHFRAVL